MIRTAIDESNSKRIPQLKVTMATVIFFKCEHTHDIIVTSSDTDMIGTGDIATCKTCNAKRLIREVTNYRKELYNTKDNESESDN